MLGGGGATWAATLPGMEDAVQEAILLLGNTRSRKRISGAKRLRKLGDPEAGPALLAALQKEVEDVRTWEPQYQMILALGLCRHAPALSFLEALARRNHKAAILYMGLGDAIFRLRVLTNSPDEALERIYGYENHGITYGGFRALAVLRLVPSEEGMRRLFEVASDPHAVATVRRFPGDPVGLRLWAAVASTEWPSAAKAEFLAACAEVRDERLQEAVADSRAGTRRNWWPY